VTVDDPLFWYYVGHCPLSELRFTQMTFWELSLLSFSSDWFSLY